MAGLGTMAALGGEYFLAVLFGAGATFAGRKLLDRRGNTPKELLRRARRDAAEVNRGARSDGIAAPQMKRLSGLQEGVFERWELLPEEYGALL